MTELTDAEIKEVLLLSAFYDTEDIWWRWNEKDHSVLQMFVNCSDFFFWGCSDSEEITSDNLPILKEAYQDMAELKLDRNFQEPNLLFCARIREMRPQGAYYKYLKEATWPLFDACGPAREVGLGNPKDHPSD